MDYRTSICGFLWIILAFFSGSFIAVAQEPIPNAAQKNPAASGPLVDVPWLLQNNNAEKVRLITLGQTVQEYRAGHIPNAVFLDWKTQISDPAQSDLFNLPPQKEVESLLSNLGVTPEMTVVICDNRSNRLSTRLFWTLKVYGHPSIKILNGGVTAWQQAGKKLTTSIINVAPTVYKASPESKAWAAANFVDTPSLQDLIGKGVVTIDGRPTNQFTGAQPGTAFHTGKPHKRLGHMKSAINVPWKANFTEDGKFKSVQALRAIYAEAGIDADQPIVTYCNEGLHAAPAWFVLKELLKFPDVKLYDDSMGVWANRDDTPMEQTEDLQD
jgi:thiosulfate/3-mercaptopyruvate sulfurtransferase